MNYFESLIRMILKVFYSLIFIFSEKISFMIRFFILKIDILENHNCIIRSGIGMEHLPTDIQFLLTESILHLSFTILFVLTKSHSIKIKIY